MFFANGLETVRVKCYVFVHIFEVLALGKRVSSTPSTLRALLVAFVPIPLRRRTVRRSRGLWSAAP